MAVRGRGCIWRSNIYYISIVFSRLHYSVIYVTLARARTLSTPSATAAAAAPDHKHTTGLFANGWNAACGGEACSDTHTHTHSFRG